MSGIIPPVEAGPVGVEHHALSAQNEVRAPPCPPDERGVGLRRTGFMLAAMLTALLMVSGVALAEEILDTPKNDRITFGSPFGTAVPISVVVGPSVLTFDRATRTISPSRPQAGGKARSKAVATRTNGMQPRILENRSKTLLA
jgi:hypothetical protein